MKFRMAPNSLFAILLRSPWWMSFAVAALIVLISAALLPAQYVPFGAIGALPMVAIGCVAFWRQWRAPSGQQIEHTLAALHAMSGPQLAQALQAAWTRTGYQVQPCQHPGADWCLQRGAQRLIVSSQRHKAAHHGIEPLRELHAAMQAQPEAGTGLYLMSQGTVSDKARAFAKAHDIAFMTAENIVALLLARGPN